MCVHVLTPTCIICGEVEEQHLLIREKAICCTCEKRMVAVTLEDPEYFFFLHQLPKLWIDEASNPDLLNQTE